MDVFQDAVRALNEGNEPDVDDVAVNERAVLSHKVKDRFPIDNVRRVDVLDEVRDIGAVDRKTIGVVPEVAVS
jgi:hypothetical protein